MNTMVLAIAGIVTAGSGVGYAFLGPLGESGTDCDSKPLEDEKSTAFTLRMKLTNIDGEPDVRICVFTHDKVQKVYDSVVKVPAGTTSVVDVDMPSRIFFLNAYEIVYELAHGSAGAAGVDDSCGSRVIEVPFTYGADLIHSASGECVEPGPAGGREPTVRRRQAEA